MSVIRIKSNNEGPRAESGTGMDKVVASTGLSQRTKIAIAAAAVLVLALLFWWFAPSAGSHVMTESRYGIFTLHPEDEMCPPPTYRARAKMLLTALLRPAQMSGPK